MSVVSLVDYIDERVRASAADVVRNHLARSSEAMARQIVERIAFVAGNEWDADLTDFACQAAEEEFQRLVIDAVYRLVGEVAR